MELLDAVKDGDLERVKKLLKNLTFLKNFSKNLTLTLTLM